MATKKDLVEAYSFSKRRLVTAFLSGAPGGREVEPSRPGRTIVGGVALAVLLVAGAAVTGVFKPRTDAGWQNPGLVTSKERATDYLILEPPPGEAPLLRPLINITSAMLLFGADVEPTRVPEQELTTLEIGEPIGILNAPASPPASERLIHDSWTACTGAGLGVQLSLTTGPTATPAPRLGFLVKSGGVKYLVAEAEAADGEQPRAYRYEIPDGISHTRVQALTGSIPRQAVAVPPAWLGLFPEGEPLTPESLGLGRLGRPASYAGRQGIPDRARIGDYYQSGARTYAIGADGPVDLSPFALELLQAHPGARELQVTADPGVNLPEPTYADLPEEVPLPPAGQLCADLHPDPMRPVVRLAERPEPGATATGVPEGEIHYHVDSGAGAYVRSGQWDNEVDVGPGDSDMVATEEFLVDSRGRRFLLQGGDVAERLGYGDVTPPVAPEAWVGLFDEGVTLSVAAAGCPPERGSGEPCG